MPWVAERAPEGWKATHPTKSNPDDPRYEALSEHEEEFDVDTHKQAWARLLAKVYEVDPFLCPKCGAQMKVIAIIEDPDEMTGTIHGSLVAEVAPSSGRVPLPRAMALPLTYPSISAYSLRRLRDSAGGGGFHPREKCRPGDDL